MNLKLNEINSIKEQISSVIVITNQLDQRQSYSKDRTQREMQKKLRIEKKKQSMTDHSLEPIIINNKKL